MCGGEGGGGEGWHLGAEPRHFLAVAVAVAVAVLAAVTQHPLDEGRYLECVCVWRARLCLRVIVFACDCMGVRRDACVSVLSVRASGRAGGPRLRLLLGVKLPELRLRHLARPRLPRLETVGSR